MSVGNAFMEGERIIPLFVINVLLLLAGAFVNWNGDYVQKLVPAS